MDFQAIPLDNKRYYVRKHQNNFGIYKQIRVAKMEKMCLGTQKRRHKNVRYVSGQKGLFKKGNKRIRNERTRLLQEVRAFHKSYFSLRAYNQDFMEPEQTKRQMVCHCTLGRNGTENIWRPPGEHSRKRGIHSLSSVSSPGIRSMERNRTFCCTYEIGGRGFHPRKDPSSW